MSIKNQGRTKMPGQDVWYVKARNSWYYPFG